MLSGQPQELITARLVLRPIRIEHAPAFWEVLRDPAMYEWIERAPPGARSDVEARFARIARIAQSIAQGRAEQWLNWTVWTRDGDEAVGIVEATVQPTNVVQVAYMFAPRVWGQGFAREAMAAALEAMSQSGAVAFEATIDTRNARSLALIKRLGFALSETHETQMEAVWRRHG